MTKNTIIVTGGSKGIGAAIATELDRRGYHVICVSRSGEAPVGEGRACDMTDEAAVRAMFAETARTSGIIGLVNNAGVHIHGMIASLETADYERVMRLNATAVMIASREAYPHLRGEGTIVNIGSFFDKLGVPDNFAYCASKAAVGAMTRCMAVEWARDNIRVLNVAPGYIATDLNKDFLASEKTRAWLSKRIPTQRAGGSDEVARLVGSLFSENIGFLTGETIYVDGGQGMNH
ncbi:NAD(P)-dependent dehydrogenase, short-chain alcohol dehydrogenase family [Sphingobium sp. AP50]|uniref:SDR family NAD(P)-dependent oxidoreductase n=1 Tax=Sphingobium sp. AP50 TaxID=1884369 RepID=UPI0008B9EB8B|nr:SDR family oxidoreductase [Sphingobium sp. AP50]SEJ66257.1 NAD(P)-dependent dehydrogenase, short-chain alcohol dehydrogenase family [Sphingobium sp. AP50]